MRLYLRFTVAFLLLFAATVQAADENVIVFSASPTHTRSETIRLYTPLMNFLSKATGKKFEIDPAANFIEYSVRMRLGKYDMLFDGSHLAGWRMANMDHTPIVRLPGDIRIVVVADRDSSLDSMGDLEGGFARVCAYSSPDMLTMAFLSYFPNPIRQPQLVRTRGQDELFDCLKRHHGEAAVLRDTTWDSMSEEAKGSMKLLARPDRAYPERTFTLSNKIDSALRKQIAEALLSEQGQKVSEELLNRFNKKALIAANPEDYKGLDRLLSPVWGFHSRY